MMNIENRLKRFKNKYNRSYRKEYYKNYTDIHELEEVRENLLFKIIDDRQHLDRLYNLKGKCKKNLVKMYNNYVYLEMIINK